MRWPYILSLFALLGAGLLLFFNILCGAGTSSVLGKFYWLEAGTSGISGAHSTTRWTNYNSCGVTNGRNSDCSSSQPGYPMSPRSNFGSSSGIPSCLSSRKGVTYYLSRVGWAFLLIGLLFTLLALLPVAVSFCLPSLSILAIGSSFATNAALLFTTLAACLLTAGYVKARNCFKSEGRHTSLGKKMFAFVWTSVFLLFLSSLFSGVGCIGSLFSSRKNKKRAADDYDSSSHETYGNNYMQEKRNDPEHGRGGFFSRKKKQNEDLEDVGYAAGLGAAGVGTGAAATAGTGAGNTRGVGATDDTIRNPQTGETLDAVAYNAGLGASGATSDYTHQPSQAHTKDSSSGSGLGKAAGLGGVAAAGAAALTGHNKSKKNDTIPEDNEASYGSNYGDASGAGTGEDLDNVGYNAGYGASGAKSSKTKDAYGTSGTTGNDEDLQDVGYKAGYGASGADSGKTRDLTGSNSGANTKAAQYDSHSKPNQMYGAGVGKQDYYHPETGAAGTSAHDDPSKPNAGTYDDSSSKPYDTDAATGYGSKTNDPNYGENADTSNSDKGLWGAAAAAAALGLGGAAAASQHHGADRNTDATDEYGSDSTHNRGTNKDYADSRNAYGSNTGAKDYGGSATRGSGTSETATGANYNGADYQDQTHYGDKSTTTGASGARTGSKGTNSSGAATRGPGYYSAEGTDVGEGATHAGANAEKTRKERDQFENKSTAMPVGSYHHARDTYGNESQGYDTGVSGSGANSAAAAAAASAGVGAAGVGAAGTSHSGKPSSDPAGDYSSNYYRTSKEGPAVRPKDTYNNLYANSKDNDDVTDTTGYEPTNYYKRKTGEDFNTGKETPADSDKVYGASQGTQYGAGNSSGRTGNAADEATTASNAGKGGFFGTLLGGKRKSAVTDNDSDLAKRNSTSSSVYDDTASDRNTGTTSTRGAGTGAYGSSRDTTGTGADTGIGGYGSSSNKRDTTTTGQGYKDDSNTGQTDDYSRSSDNKNSGSNVNRDALLGAGAVGAGAAATYGAGKTGHKQELSQGKDLYDKHGDKVKEQIGAFGKDSKTKDSSKAGGAYSTSPSTTKDSSHGKGYDPSSSTSGNKSSKTKTKGPNGETLDDVGYSAGVGASGATADKSKFSDSTHGSSGIKGAEREYGSSTREKHDSTGQNRYGQDYGTTSGSKSNNRGDIAASAAAALGLGSATGAAGSSGSRDHADTSKYHGTSGAKEDIYSGSDSKATSTDKYSSSNKGTHSAAGTGTGTGTGAGAYSGSRENRGDTTSTGYGKYDRDATAASAATGSSRNRNPIAEGLTGSSAGKPTTAAGIDSMGTGTGHHTNNDYGRTGPSTGDKLESGTSGQERSRQYGSKAAKVGTQDDKLSTGEKLRGTNDTTSSSNKKSYAGAASGATLGSGLGAAGSSGTSSGRDTHGSSNKYDTTSAAGKSTSGYGSSNTGRYEGEDYYNDDSVPGTFPSGQVSSPTQKRAGTTSDSQYTTQGRGQSAYTSSANDTTPRYTQQTQQVEYDAQGNPIKKEGILDVLVDTAKSVI